MCCWRFISVPAYCSFACSGYVKYWSILWQTLWLCGTFVPRLLLQFFWWLILEDGINLIQSLQAETRLVWYSTLKCHCLRMLLCLTRICFRHSSYQRIKIVPPFSTSRVRSIGIGFVLFIIVFSTRPVCYPLSVIWILISLTKLFPCISQIMKNVTTSTSRCFLVVENIYLHCFYVY